MSLLECVVVHSCEVGRGGAAAAPAHHGAAAAPAHRGAAAAHAHSLACYEHEMLHKQL